MIKRFKLLPFFLILILIILGYVFTNPLRTKKLTEREKQSIPYKGNEILVFKSNKHELDTLQIKEITIRQHPPNLGDMFWAKNTEVLRVHQDVDCNNCDAIVTYSVQNFSSETNIYYDIKINGNRYYHGTKFRELDKLKPNTIKIGGIELDDVVFIDRVSEKYNSGHIDRLYWSKSNGIVRIDVNPKYYWELINE